MIKSKFIGTKVRTGLVRFSYAHVWAPKAAVEGAKEKFSVSVIIPKSDTQTIADIERATKAAYEEGESRLKGNSKSVPAQQALKTPLRDGDLERPDDEAYKDSYFLNANSTTAPGIVDADRQPIYDHSEFKSGDYGRVTLNFYAFNTGSAKGIACGLQNIQKLKDGEPLGGVRASAEDDFADDDFLA